MPLTPANTSVLAVLSTQGEADPQSAHEDASIYIYTYKDLIRAVSGRSANKVCRELLMTHVLCTACHRVKNGLDNYGRPE